MGCGASAERGQDVDGPLGAQPQPQPQAQQPPPQQQQQQAITPQSAAAHPPAPVSVRPIPTFGAPTHETDAKGSGAAAVKPEAAPAAAERVSHTTPSKPAAAAVAMTTDKKDDSSARSAQVAPVPPPTAAAVAPPAPQPQAASEPAPQKEKTAPAAAATPVVAAALVAAATNPAAAAAVAAASAPSSKPAPAAANPSASPSTLSSDIAACDESLLFVLRLDTPATAEELAVVHEMQPPEHLVSIAEGPGQLDERVGALSWRWDIAKPPTLAEAAKLPLSPKVVAAIKRARAMGLKWLWLDWCVVPQYSELSLILNHVRSSRFVYEKCTVLLVDVVEVAPDMGLFIPTKDYMSRLWTTAEMASMLANPAVSYGTFVQMRRWHWKSIILAVDAMFSAGMIRENFVQSYFEFFRSYVDVENPCADFHFAQKCLHAIVYNSGAAYMREKYGPQLCDWLCSNTSRLQVLDASPLSQAEEEQLIEEFGRECDWDARKSPHCKPIFEAVAQSKRMPNAYKHTAHYKGYLLLAADAVRDLLRTWQFNGGAFKSVLQRLGVHIPGSAPIASNDPAEGALQCFLASDVEKVREMMMAARGRVNFPVMLPGITFVPTPTKLWMTEQHKPDASLATPKGSPCPRLSHLLQQCSIPGRTSRDDSVASLRMVSVSLNFTPAGADDKPAVFHQLSVDLYGPHSVARFGVAHPTFGQSCDEAGAEVSLTLENNAAWIHPHVATDRFGHRLADDEFWINMQLANSTGNAEVRTLSLFRAAKGQATAGTLARLVGGVEKWADVSFRACKTDDARKAFLADEAGETQQRLVELVKAAGFTVGAPLSEAIPPPDSRPDMVPEDAASAGSEAELKKAMIAKLLAIPCVTTMWGMNEATLAMMPDLGMLLTSAETTQQALDGVAAETAGAQEWGSAEADAAEAGELQLEEAADSFAGSASEFSDAEVAALIKLIGDQYRDDMVPTLRSQLESQAGKAFHSLQQCKDVVGAFWREEEAAAGHLVESRWKGSRADFLDAMRAQMWGFDDAFPGEAAA